MPAEQRNGGPRFGRGPNSAIPSRSFQMLQAMVSDPSACGKCNRYSIV